MVRLRSWAWPAHWLLTCPRTLRTRAPRAFVVGRSWPPGCAIAWHKPTIALMRRPAHHSAAATGSAPAPSTANEWDGELAARSPPRSTVDDEHPGALQALVLSHARPRMTGDSRCCALRFAAPARIAVDAAMVLIVCRHMGTSELLPAGAPFQPPSGFYEYSTSVSSMYFSGIAGGSSLRIAARHTLVRSSSRRSTKRPPINFGFFSRT